MVVAVDGPAGAGKSSIAKLVAEKYNLEFIDSGAIYRSVTKKILDSGLKIDDYTEIEKFSSDLAVSMDSGKVYVNGADYSAFIRDRDVTDAVSVVSANECIRRVVNTFLNSYALGKSIIMDGRDIGTEVFPDADYKFYLDASSEERARRRCLESGGISSSFEEIRTAIEKRDSNDMNRKVGPLKRADDAVYIDTTKLTIDEVVNEIIKCFK